MKRSFFKIVLVSVLLLFLLVFTNANFSEIYSLPNNFVASYDEVKDINFNKKFGTLVSARIEKNIFSTSDGASEQEVVVFKLFGFIPIRKVKIKVLPEEDVYVGGIPIGVSILNSGPIVVNQEEVVLEDCVILTEKTQNLKRGDVIFEIDGQKVETIEDVENLVNSKNEMDDVEVKFLRKNKEMKSIIKAVKAKDGRLKLGLLVKDDISGIGTLTYVNAKTGDFGAVGHAITEDENVAKVLDGKVYPCNIFDVQKGERNNPGQLKGVFLQNGGEKGSIEKNNKYGVFGKMEDLEGIVDQNLLLKLGGRLSVTPGKAKIVSSVSGIREEYDIEIIKANYQSKADDKSLVFRVIDKRLLNITGGIVQGMSGSPIIQNGKLVGAVTHVFTSDPTKGYGVYSDWMVLNG